MIQRLERTDKLQGFSTIPESVPIWSAEVWEPFRSFELVAPGGRLWSITIGAIVLMLPEKGAVVLPSTPIRLELHDPPLAGQLIRVDLEPAGGGPPPFLILRPMRLPKHEAQRAGRGPFGESCAEAFRRRPVVVIR